ncbi:hypothetical protein PV04_00746 [Phialophora macrospora]|uniref:Major facilitator superfamily (MFS) profile domain-containing protein n=1 Tax=Phialophora macrospora TaxID=1851006 RepID=A0A0D2GJM4_9EURO|nr:hypothetical protein PV04_00746 [Phialophora macrospora]
MAESETIAMHREAVLPPGTVHLLHLHTNRADEKILVPKPSDHPDDPLNWSKARKLLNVSLVLLYVFTTGVGGTSVYSVLTPISQDTGITIAQLNNGTGYLFLLAGWSNLIWQPLALTFGRRPVILLSLVGCVAITEWTAWIDSYGPWAAARCLYGFVCAPVEVLPEICIPDIFFAHERGGYIGIYMMVLCGSNFIAPLIAGFMNDAYGWHWVQHWAAILLGANLVLSFFLQEETLFSRSTVEAERVDEVSSPVEREETFPEKGPVTDSTATASTIPVTASTYRVKTYRDKLSLWTHSGISASQFLRMMYRPVLIFFQFPNITWAGFMYGSSLAWYNVYNATTSVILSSPPYNFSPAMVGLSYVAPLIGTLIAGALTGPVSDWYTLKLARRAGGLREPEQRLWGLVLYCILMPVGLILWGIGAAHKLHWAVLLLGSILNGYCNVAGGSYAIAYNVDSFKEIAGESIVSVILCRNSMSFGFNYAITPWIAQQGLQDTFIAVSILSCAFGCTFLLMVWKGKYLRTVCADRYWRYAATQVVKHE